MAITGAIFDLDGTLLDSMDAWRDVGVWYLECLKIQAEPGLGERLYTMTLEEGASYMKSRYGLSAAVDEIEEEVKRLVYCFYRDEVRLKPGVRAFLKCLKKKGILMAVATAGDRLLAEAALTRLGLIPEYFRPEQIFTCSEVGAGKDVPDIYHRAKEALGTVKESTWVFEDAFHGAETAAAAGYPVAGIWDRSGEKTLERLKQVSRVYHNSFEEYSLQDFER